MYERFTDRARKVMQLANQEAQRFNAKHISTEHLLLGLIKEGSGVAACVLKNFNLSLEQIRNQIEKTVWVGPDIVTMGSLPQTPQTKKVLEYAIEESGKLNHSYVGTEHLLLGLLRDQEGTASQVLANLNVKLDDVRKEVLDLLGHEKGDNNASDPGLPLVKRLAREIMGLTLWEYAELNKELRRFGVTGARMNESVRTTWNVITSFDLPSNPKAPTDDKAPRKPDDEH